MGTLMQLLLEALRVNVENNDRSNEIGPVENQITDQMSGFILENVQVATIPYIGSDEEEEAPNPLLQLVHDRDRPLKGSNPRNIHKILDHVVELEKKIEKLERCIPPKRFRQRLWLAPTAISEDGRSYDDSDHSEEGKYADHATIEKHHSGSRKGSPALKSKSPPRGSPKVEGHPSRTTSRRLRLEKEDRSCFARLLFSRCWTGKDNAAGWKIKRRCPTGQKMSLSCPCGQIGPCQKVKRNPVPIDKMKSTPPEKKPTKATASSGGSKLSQKRTDSKNQKKNGSSKVDNPTGKPFYEKLLPCCFKGHMHNECCCRCKDNPALTCHTESKGDVKKSSVPKRELAPKKQSRQATPDHRSASPSQYSGDERGSEYGDDQPEYQTFNIRSISNLSPKEHEKINQLSRKQATGDIMRIKSKRMDSSTTRPLRAKKEVESNLRRVGPNNEVPDESAKSTTSFQIMLHPDISNDQILEPEVVSHQILKTLSTIHGPVKVEQKIVVQGTKNSVVIVTHGETCECNLCNMLKGKMHPGELVEGLSPQVVKISTDNGRNTLINHSDGCKCELCLVLDPAVTRNVEHRTPQLENEKLVLAACSKSNENGYSEKRIPEATVQNSHSSDHSTPTAPATELRKYRNGMIRSHSLIKKSKCRTQSGKKKTKKCRCTKCRQRRRVEKLKMRLKKEMGTEEYDRILHEIARCNDDHTEREAPKRIKPLIQRDSEENVDVEPNRNKKSVSFSSDPDPTDQADSEVPEVYIRSNEKARKRCKLCELVNMNVRQPDGIFKRDKDTIKSCRSQNHNSAVYSMKANSHEVPCEFPLQSKSKSSENGMYRLISEEQKCFPPGHIPRHSRNKKAPAEKKIKDEVREESNLFEEDTGRSQVLNESSFSGRYRLEGPRDEVNGHSAILLQEGGFPQKFVYWAPISRSNLATVYSSDSYYVPEQDEFPIVNMECEDCIPSSGRDASSGGAPVQRQQIPIWYRMLPDRNAR